MIFAWYGCWPFGSTLSGEQRCNHARMPLSRVLVACLRAVSLRCHSNSGPSPDGEQDQRSSTAARRCAAATGPPLLGLPISDTAPASAACSATSSHSGCASPPPPLASAVSLAALRHLTYPCLYAQARQRRLEIDGASVDTSADGAPKLGGWSRGIVSVREGGGFAVLLAPADMPGYRAIGQVVKGYSGLGYAEAAMNIPCGSWRSCTSTCIWGHTHARRTQLNRRPHPC